MTFTVRRVLLVVVAVVLVAMALLLFLRPLEAGTGDGKGGPITRVHTDRG